MYMFMCLNACDHARLALMCNRIKSSYYYLVYDVYDQLCLFAWICVFASFFYFSANQCWYCMYQKTILSMLLKFNSNQCYQLIVLAFSFWNCQLSCEIPFHASLNFPFTFISIIALAFFKLISAWILIDLFFFFFLVFFFSQLVVLKLKDLQCELLCFSQLTV